MASDSFEKMTAKGISIYRGDAVVILPKLKKKVDTVICSPPDNLFGFDWLDALAPLLKDTGSIFAFAADNYVADLKYCLDGEFGRDNMRNWIIWHNEPDKYDTAEINRFVPGHKHILWYTKSKEYKFNPPVKGMSDVWSAKEPPGNRLPPDILKFLIAVSTNKTDIVLDPFMWDGDSGVIAKELERKYIGIELNDAAFESAGTRIFS